MIEIIVQILILGSVGVAGIAGGVSWGYCLRIGSMGRKAKAIARRVPQYVRDEIDQNAAWWDREFTRLMRKTDPLYGYSPEYVRAGKVRADIVADGIMGLKTIQASLNRPRFSGGGWIPMDLGERSFPPPPASDPNVFVKVLG